MIPEPKKKHFSIKEVSQMLDLPYPTLRFWEKSVVQLQPRTNAGRTRFYSEEDIRILRRLIYFRSQNIPVKDWSQRLRIEDKGLDRKAEAHANLLAIRDELEAIRKLL